jgi:GNAT superfamily N-acetyltransferase
VLYAEEQGWDERFEALVAAVVADYVKTKGARSAAWIAEVDGERAGSIFCMPKDEHTAQLRLLLVEPRFRGHGIGARLVEECVRFARGAGYARMTLWTNDALREARKLYERAGFELVEESRHRSFGPELTGQTWLLELRRPAPRA